MSLLMGQGALLVLGSAGLTYCWCFCEGKGPFRWVALSGDPADITVTDQIILDLFPEDEALCRWMKMAGERIAYQGLPARIYWLGYGERAKAGRAGLGSRRPVLLAVCGACAARS